MQEMTRAYALLLAAAQPEGPFFLLGWSLGGALAIGVAHHLERMGRTVEFLGFVDGFVPSAPQSNRLDAKDEAPRGDGVGADVETPELRRFRPDEIALGRAVMDRLTALSRAYSLPEVRVRPHCWWASETANDAMLAQQSLERALGQMPKLSAIVPSDHANILWSEEFLRSVCEAIHPSPSSSPALARSHT
jgi:pimeloyl-ACP methyl ester carboxylesterase